MKVKAEIELDVEVFVEKGDPDVGLDTGILIESIEIDGLDITSNLKGDDFRSIDNAVFNELEKRNWKGDF